MRGVRKDKSRIGVNDRIDCAAMRLTGLKPLKILRRDLRDGAERPHISSLCNSRAMK